MILLYMLSAFCFLVFFFKQQTAYELRISDWSSDVCSSDLPRTSAPNRSSRSAPAPRPASATRALDNCAASTRDRPEARGAPRDRVCPDPRSGRARRDRKRGVKGKREAVRVDLGCSRILKKKHRYHKVIINNIIIYKI